MFLENADIVQYAFDNINCYILLSVAPKINKRVIFYIQYTQCHLIMTIQKRRNKCILKWKKGGVDSHDQMCAVYTTAKNQIVGQWGFLRHDLQRCSERIFNFHAHCTEFWGQKVRQKVKILTELALSLIIPHAKFKLG